MVNTGNSNGNLHGMPFSTYDQNNDPYRYCGSSSESGWWFNNDCAATNLNMAWEWVLWYPVVPVETDVRGTLMMIRPN